MSALLISNFPLPPSENALYRNVPRVGRVATQELKDYRRACEYWGLQNKKYKQLFFEMYSELKDHVVKVDSYYVMKNERIWTKDKRIKRLDASNRLKASNDQLAQYLGVDDSLFFNVSAEKVSGENECVVLLISFIKPMSVVELLSSFTENSQESDTIQ